MADLEPHAYVESFVMKEIKWTELVSAGTRIHVLHGGTSDEVGIYHCAAHLQGVWGVGLIRVQTREQMLDVLRSIASTSTAKTRLLVCLPAEAIAAYPAGYDLLVAMPHITVVVTIPVTTVRGKPYSSRSDIVVLMLPSCRADVDSIYTTADIYRFPESKSFLEQALWSLPHEVGISWRVGDKLVSHADFAGAGVAATAAQENLDRAFWWAANTRPRPGVAQLPPVISSLVTTKRSPFYPTPDVSPVRIDPTTIRLRTNMDRDLLTQVRSDSDRSTQSCDFHAITADGAVFPFKMVLAHCREEAVVEDDEDTVIYLIGPCTFLATTPKDAYTPAETPTWKTFVSALPEI
jgi:hypothetical protein